MSSLASLLTLTAEEMWKRIQDLDENVLNQHLSAQGFTIGNLTKQQKDRLFFHVMKYQKEKVEQKSPDCIGLISDASEDCKICNTTKKCKEIFDQVLSKDPIKKEEKKIEPPKVDTTKIINMEASEVEDLEDEKDDNDDEEPEITEMKQKMKIRAEKPAKKEEIKSKEISVPVDSSGIINPYKQNGKSSDKYNYVLFEIYKNNIGKKVLIKDLTKQACDLYKELYKENREFPVKSSWSLGVVAMGGILFNVIDEEISIKKISDDIRPKNPYDKAKEKESWAITHFSTQFAFNKPFDTIQLMGFIEKEIGKKVDVTTSESKKILKKAGLNLIKVLNDFVLVCMG
jgi:hypothetical protein